MKLNQQFLHNYLNAFAPVAQESAGQAIWTEYLKPHVDFLKQDAYGTSYGVIRGEGEALPKVVIEAHCDEIAWIITNIEDDGVVRLCAEHGKPLVCTFRLESRTFSQNQFVMDGLNVENAASDLWINRLLDVHDNIVEIEHYYGLSKLFDTGDNALPGVTPEEYRYATQNINGQPKLIWMGPSNRYFYTQEGFEDNENGIPISYSWVIDTDQIDASKVDLQTEFIFHTVMKVRSDEKVILTRSHMTCQDSRTISAWFYINACVVSSFVYMYTNKQLPTNGKDYNLVDHSVFSDNIFGARFRIT